MVCCLFTDDGEEMSLVYTRIEVRISYNCQCKDYYSPLSLCVSMALCILDIMAKLCANKILFDLTTVKIFLRNLQLEADLAQTVIA
jgi:hypothetical protein